jgi:hypothetical protein
MTADEFVAVNFRLWQRRRSTRRAYWLLGTALAVLALSVVVEVVQIGRLMHVSTLVFLMVGIAYGLFRVWLVRYQLRSGYSRNTGLHHPTDFTFDLDKLKGHGPHGRFEAKLRTVRRAVWVQPHWLLLYPTETACYYVDLRHIQAPGTPEQLLELVRTTGVPVTEL